MPKTSSRTRDVLKPTEAAKAYRNLVVGRACGLCRACCKLPDIPELHKPINTWCAHADFENPEGGCSIHARRPATCRGFECAWLSGLGDEQDRPDRLGVMYQPIKMPDGSQGLAAVEFHSGALESARVQAQLERFYEAKPGRIFVRRAAEASFRPVTLTIGGAPAMAALERFEPKATPKTRVQADAIRRALSAGRV